MSIHIKYGFSIDIMESEYQNFCAFFVHWLEALEWFDFVVRPHKYSRAFLSPLGKIFSILIRLYVI